MKHILPILAMLTLANCGMNPAIAQPLPKPRPPASVIEQIRSVVLDDLRTASTEAKAMNDTIAAQCYDAWIAFAEARQTTLSNGGNPGVVTKFQRARDFVNAMRPGSGIKIACAPLAEELKSDVIGLLGKIAGGALSAGTLLPLIP
jgi:hypothetical protein